MSEDILRKIRGLLAKAEGTDIEAEAQTFHEAAMRLMRKYQIDEAELIASGRQSGYTVEGKIIRFERCIGRDDKVYMARVLAELHHGRVINIRPRNETARSYGSPGGFHLIGSPQDIIMVEALWTSLCLQLDVVTARYVRENSGMGVHGRTLRSSFIHGWVDRVAARLKELYGEEDERTSSSTSLVLASKKTASDEYVSQNLTLKKASSRMVRVDPVSALAGSLEGNRADIGQVKVTQGTTQRLAE